MLRVNFRLNGRSIAPNRIGREVQRLALDAGNKELRKRVEQIRCPEHHQTAKLIPAGTTTKERTFDVQGCCERLIQAVNEALR